MPKATCPRGQFDASRANLDGRPDAVQSIVTIVPTVIPPNGVSTTTMTVTPRDWSGGPLTTPIRALSVAHAADSAGLSSIGRPVTNADGTIDVTLRAVDRTRDRPLRNPAG